MVLTQLSKEIPPAPANETMVILEMASTKKKKKRKNRRKGNNQIGQVILVAENGNNTPEMWKYS